MAKKIDSKTQQAIAHQKRVERYVLMLSSIFEKATEEYAKLAMKSGYSDDVQFSWDDYPALKKKAIAVTSDLEKELESAIQSYVSTEWKKSAEFSKSAFIAKLVAGGIGADIVKELVDNSFGRMSDALNEFLKRKDKGIGLSHRVWNIAKGYEIENEIALAISTGKSADELSRSIRKNLVEPNKLFRRVKDKYGELRLSKRAKAYHPQAGAYRSSYKNAVRLARTEINMAYRAADMAAYNEEFMVVGYEVKRSNHPYDCPICESLKGKYPKTFKFIGWHPNCRCFTIPILNTKEEREKQYQAIMDGKPISEESVNTVKSPPDGFYNWIDKNKERIEIAQKRGTLPYFLKDNKKFF